MKIKLPKSGGERGIRTLDTFDRIHAFQACSLNRSDISPWEEAFRTTPKNGAHLMTAAR